MTELANVLNSRRCALEVDNDKVRDDVESQDKDLNVNVYSVHLLA